MYTIAKTNAAIAVSACRLCMLSLPESSMEPNIFKSSEAGSISNKIASVTRLRLYEGDGLPTTVCHQCIFQLTMADQFIQKCTLSNKFFQSKLPPCSQRENNISSDDNVDDSSLLASWKKAMQTPPPEEFLLALEFVKSTHETELNETDHIFLPVCEGPGNETNCEADVEQCGLFDFENVAEIYDYLEEVDDISITMEEFEELSFSLTVRDLGVDYCNSSTGSDNALEANSGFAPLPLEKLLVPSLEENMNVNTTYTFEQSSSRIDNIYTKEQLVDAVFCNTSTCAYDTLKVNLDSAPLPVEKLLQPASEENINANTTSSSQHFTSGVDNISTTMEEFGELSCSLTPKDFCVDYCNSPTDSDNALHVNLSSALLPVEKLLKPSLNETINVNTTGPSGHSTKEQLVNAVFCDTSICAYDTLKVNLDSAPLPVEKLLKPTSEENINANTTSSSQHFSSGIYNISTTMEEFGKLSFSLTPKDLCVDYRNSPTDSDNALHINLSSALLPVKRLLKPSLNENMNVNTTGPSGHSSSSEDNISTKESFLDAGFSDISTCADDKLKVHLNSASLPLEKLLESTLEENMNVDSTGSSEHSSSSVIDKIKKEFAKNQHDPLLLTNAVVRLTPLSITDNFYRQAVEKMKARQAGKQLVHSSIQLPNCSNRISREKKPHISLNNKGMQPKLAMTRSKLLLAANKSASQRFNCGKCSSTFASKVVLAMHIQSQVCERQLLKLTKAAVSRHKRELLEKSNIPKGTPMHQLVLHPKLEGTSQSLKFVLKRVQNLNDTTFSFKCSHCSCTYMHKCSLQRHTKLNHPATHQKEKW